MMKEDLTARLLAASAFTDIIGDSLRWVQRFEADAYPAATLQIISDPRPVTFDGPDGTRRSIVQLDGWGLTNADATAVVEAAISALQPSRETVGGTFFDQITADEVRDLGEQTTNGFIHRASVDLTIWHHPA